MLIKVSSTYKKLNPDKEKKHKKTQNDGSSHLKLLTSEEEIGTRQQAGLDLLKLFVFMSTYHYLPGGDRLYGYAFANLYQIIYNCITNDCIDPSSSPS
jgi:hypothetical protein